MDNISIHALCEEGDGASCPSMVRKANFYPRPLRGGRPRYAVEHGAAEDISIHALCEEGDRGISCRLVHLFPISIHALREEGDQLVFDAIQREFQFLSTPSARRATRQTVWKDVKKAISIHALREEGDELPADWEVDEPYFYPRPPRGGRQLPDP